MVESTESIEYYTWLEAGITAGHCSEPDCNTHNGIPSTPQEDAAWEAGLDPCVPVVRLYPPE